MRYIIVPALVALLVAACQTAVATPPPDQPSPKLGYVDMAKVMKDSETVKKAGAALQADVAKWNTEIAAKDADAKKVEADKKATPAEKKAARDAATSLLQRYQGDQQKRAAELDAGLAKLVDAAAGKLGADRGVDVLPVKPLFARAGVDVTADLIKAMDGPPPPDPEVVALKARVKELEAQRKP